MSGVSQGESVSTIAGEGYSWDSVSLAGDGVSWTGGGFNPIDLFFSGEQGAWYDPSDLSTMFQDSAGTTPVTADGQTVGKILDKSGRGNHAVAPSDAARPLYKTDGTYHWLQFDGVDDSLSTAAINFTSTDNMSAWMGVLPSASTGFIVSTGTNPDTDAGSLRYDLATGSKFVYQLRGVTSRSIKSTADGFSFPSKNVNYGSLKFGTVSEIISRVNGSLRTLTNLETTNPVVGPFGNLAMHIGRRGDNFFHYTGNIYSLIVRGALSTTQEITDTETWVNSKCGAF